MQPPGTHFRGHGSTGTAAGRSRLGWLVKLGTERYAAPIRRRLEIMNLTALCVATFTLIYAVQQTVLDFQTWKPVILINLGLAATACAVPFLHRFGPIAAVLALGLAEYVGLFVLTAYVGRDSGLHIQYAAAVCVFFIVIGVERVVLLTLLTVVGLVLHLAAWASFPQERALLHVSAGQLDAMYVTAAVTTFAIVAIVISYALRLAERAQANSDALLHNILPSPIVERLTGEETGVIADEFAEGSVLFADLCGFVALTRSLGATRSVALLNTIVRAFDDLVECAGVEKIKTIGDGYMIAAGVPEPIDNHAGRLAGVALEMIETLERISTAQSVPLSLRVGIATGPLLGGVVEAKRSIYDIWGDTVNLASRLEGLSRPGSVLVCDRTRARLEDSFAFERRDPLDIKGFGLQQTWFLKSPRRERLAEMEPVSRLA